MPLIAEVYVMVRIKPKQFPSGTVRELQAHNVKPFKVLKQIGLNAYVNDIPPDYGISSTFNINISFITKVQKSYQMNLRNLLLSQ